MSEDILLIGSGGREHALAWKLAQSPTTRHIFVAPGNGGTELMDKVTNLPLASDDVQGLVTFAKDKAISFCVVGPEAPLAAGIKDAMDEAGIPCIGPSKAAAELESSKVFCKDFLRRHAIPTAHYASFSTIEPALTHLENSSAPWVIKADGLAAGKGVVICETLENAKATVKAMIEDEQFGDASQRIVIEEFLQGEEASFMYLVDNGDILPLATSQDHKKRDNGDLGPNTGGMGAYSPAKVTSALEERVLKEVIEPTVTGMSQEDRPYSGFLYAGIMISPAGDPYVLEFNCRLGDPETQPILMRLQSDLVKIFKNLFAGKLAQTHISWHTQSALGVVMAASGYPKSYPKGDVISGLAELTDDNVKVFHAGTQLKATSDSKQTPEVVSSGGRVLCVCALGDDLQAAQKLAYQACKQITWQNCYYRSDIGYKGLLEPIH